ncbi:Glutamate synthase domain-containing protein 2 [Thalassovita litoralis]|uniref:Glutamate synthase domain-containing protein 2 n=1 Tax=Thalassovita litoralis TaxID=1010611 RepID=A0A521B1V3_9RHOB|nr:FMN-binding glutamate synthase family protein [Thalassovita litoralis]SMO41058.1 Glutamate synthase domain-containing protein 2 [Thalassovita litoralis]
MPVPLLRMLTFYLSVVALVVSLIGIFFSDWFLVPLTIAAVLTAIGLHDLLQTKHSVLRNYPILGHIRYFFELIRPEIRQYLLEDDYEEVPFSREARAIVYQRAKGVEDKRPFGTKQKIYDSGYQWLTHSIRPKQIKNTDFRVLIGGPDCRKPYNASVYNISAMSFGALSANAILALNKGAKSGGFAHDTGEGGISRYHREGGGDLIYEIGTGYFGCRDQDGNFDPVRFAEQAASDQIKMIEIKLSQGAKPGQGGMLPAAKITPEIAEARGVPMGVDCISPASHSAFETPIQMMEFIARLRDLSGGKPVGFKLCIGHRREFMCIVRAMLETGITPDFIVVDGKEGGTGAAPLEFANHMGMPLVEGLTFVHNTLRGVGLRDQVRIGASGKLVTAFDIARVLALGADWVNSARGFMFSVGCIQAQACHTNHCPTGVATQDPARAKALVVPDKAERVANFHRNTLKALGDMTGAAGLSHPCNFLPRHFLMREKDRDMVTGDDVYPYMPEGFLLREDDDRFGYLMRWRRSASASFAPFDDGI